MAIISVRRPHYMYSYDKFQPVNFAFHMHQYYEILYFVKGNAKYVIENKEFDIDEGDVFMTRPNELHTIIFSSNSIYERHFVQFDDDFLKSLSPTVYERANNVFFTNKISRDAVKQYGIDKLFEDISVCMSKKNVEWDLLAKTYIAQMLVAICNIYNANEYTTSVSSKKITLIKQYLNSHFTDDFSLQKIAGEMFMNKYYMCHIFKEDVGMTIKEYIETLRFTYALRLHYEGKKLSDIALMCGYSDYSLFYKNFTKHSNGVSPTEFFKSNNRTPLSI
ncbi:MAG: AraC family transcriptional regulator [Clostridia bacterium]|nr:AraC family transcriptional regulator [Clostridia bacterium]